MSETKINPLAKRLAIDSTDEEVGELIGLAYDYLIDKKNIHDKGDDLNKRFNKNGRELAVNIIFTFLEYLPLDRFKTLVYGKHKDLINKRYMGMGRRPPYVGYQYVGMFGQFHNKDVFNFLFEKYKDEENFYDDISDSHKIGVFFIAAYVCANKEAAKRFGEIFHMTWGVKRYMIMTICKYKELEMAKYMLDNIKWCKDLNQVFLGNFITNDDFESVKKLIELGFDKSYLNYSHIFRWIGLNSTQLHLSNVEKYRYLESIGVFFNPGNEKDVEILKFMKQHSDYYREVNFIENQLKRNSINL